MKLELHNAGVRIENRWLVRGASLMLRPRTLTVLVGPNGSGKTTLLRLLAGLWQMTEGTATLDGAELSHIRRRDLARRIAFTPQDTHLAFAFTVRDVVLMGRHAYIGRFEREGVRDREAVEAALARADVAHLADRLVTELSGGERQRVIIARSLATQADAILLDEPTANLDIGHALDVLQLCRELAQEGKTVALALHDLNLAARYAAEVVLLSHGRIVAAGTPTEVLSEAALQQVFGVSAVQIAATTGETALFFRRTGKENTEKI
ncbi:MAG: ABC transporter ATP-binding protein [Pyrinomonadaceae bacterium]